MWAVCVALINTNLSDDSLAHAINVVAPRHIIAAGGLVNTLATVLPKLASEVQCGSHGENFHRLPRVDLEIDRYEGRRLSSSELSTTLPHGSGAIHLYFWHDRIYPKPPMSAIFG